MNEDAVAGCLLGTMLGDAVGVPLENLSPRRVARWMPVIDGPRFLFGRGMCSDDTEHACITAAALLSSVGLPLAEAEPRFARSLAWGLRGWILGLPAGVGLATLRACLRLWLGWSARTSGVWSAGNGPCMRVPVLGVCVDDPVRLAALVRVCTRITHTDPRAEAGALAVAWAARYAVRTAGSPPDAGGYLALLRSEAGFAWPAGWPGLLDRVADSLARGEPTGTFAANLCGRRGVSGFVNQTVPVALHAWFRHADDFRESVTTVIRCGGDTDTTAAVTGALAGARLGRQRLPADWLARVCEWPRTPAWVEALARRTAEALAAGTPRLSPPMRGAWAMPARNLFFFAVVLAHVFRRWLPPY